MTTAFLYFTNASSTDNATAFGNEHTLAEPKFCMELIQEFEVRAPKIKGRTHPKWYSPKTPHKNWNGRKMNGQ